MKLQSILSLILILFLDSCTIENQDSFSTYFKKGTLRIDYYHTGDAKTETVNLDQVYRYETWARNPAGLIDPLNYGTYFHKIYDLATGSLIYSKGFDSYFKEYQFSTPAIEGQVKQFHESALVPFPKGKILFAIEKRDKTGQFSEVFRIEIDPGTAQEKPTDPEVKIYTGIHNGNPQTKADISIIGDGYTEAEAQKFEADVKRFTEIFLNTEPFRSYRDRFNIQGILKPSQDSGIDEPDAGIDKNTAINATFSSMGSERYILTEDNKSLRDIAGHTPYDALLIMVNHSRYGGGGIYNSYSVFTSDNINSNYLMIHEFGHSFFGLADEYYTSSTAYNDFYPAGYEPAEPNITALADPENIKWKHLLSEGIPMPTPWEKGPYDSLDILWQAERAKLNTEIALLQKNGAPAEEVNKAKAGYDQKSMQHDREMLAYLDGSKFKGTVGAFEGAGYAATGLYRPAINCIMFTRTDYFCPVCREAMVRVIDSYTK